MDWVPDVDGDGRCDVIVASPGYPTGVAGSTGGAVFLYSGAAGTELDRLVGDFVSAPWSFAKSVSSLGDVTGDGIPEVAIGKPASQWGFLPSIQVYSVLPWSLVYEVSAPSQPSNLGSSACAGGTDLNGDGWPDFVAADYSFEANGTFGTGAVHAFNGLDGSLLWRVSGPGSSNFGQTVICPGDVNGDSYADVITRSQIFPGTIHALSGFDGSEIYRFSGDYLDGFIGIENRLAPCGDADGDGLPDYIVSQGEAPGVSKGLATVHRGRDGAIIRRWEGKVAGEGFGESVGGPGDLDADGHPDFLVSTGKIGAGRVYAFSGRDYSLLTVIESPAAPVLFGWVLGSLGDDVDGDGGFEVLLSDPAEVVGGLSNAGAAYLFTFDRWLQSDARMVSAAAGGAIAFTLDFPTSEAGLDYYLLASDDLPGSITVRGVGVPLVWTPLLQKMAFSPPPIFDQPQGALDLNGDATVTATIPPGALAAYAGRTVKFAAVSLLAPGQPSLSSAPAWVEVTP